MSAPKHTPGPWHTDDAQKGDIRRYVCSENAPFPHLVCAVKLDRPSAEYNARLIAAAPDMLKALQRITHPMADDDDIQNALDVIAQATREAK